GGRPLVTGVLVQKRRLQFALPTSVGWKGKTGGHGASGVQLQQLGGHRLDGGSRLVAYLLPGTASQAMDPRWGTVAVVAAGAVAVELIQAGARYVEAIATLILAHRHLDLATFRRQGGDATTHTDPVLEMHHVIAALEGTGQRRGGRLPIA